MYVLIYGLKYQLLLDSRIWLHYVCGMKFPSLSLSSNIFHFWQFFSIFSVLKFKIFVFQKSRFLQSDVDIAMKENKSFNNWFSYFQFYDIVTNSDNSFSHVKFYFEVNGVIWRNTFSANRVKLQIIARVHSETNLVAIRSSAPIDWTLLV